MIAKKPNQTVRDYAGLALFLVPCVGAIIFTNIILMPRYEKIIEVRFPEKEIPGILSAIIGSCRFFFQYFNFIVPVILLSIVALESFSTQWQRIRSICFKVLSYLAFILTLLAILSLATSTLALVPLLTAGS